MVRRALFGFGLWIFACRGVLGLLALWFSLPFFCGCGDVVRCDLVRVYFLGGFCFW